jgi:hypothetical protein
MESNLVAEFIAETGADKTVAYSYLQGMEFYNLELDFRFSHLRMCRASQSKKGFGSEVYHASSILWIQYYSLLTAKHYLFIHSLT